MLFLQQVDSTSVVNGITSLPSLINYVIMLVAGSLAGYVVRLLNKASAFVNQLNVFLKLAILAVLSFAVSKLNLLLGTHVSNTPLTWDATTINTVLFTAISYIVSKFGLTTSPATGKAVPRS